MINTEEFIKRIEILLDYYSLSASVFADKIGVQRSALSHLLSGRNKPSLDFIMKVNENFPEVDLYWLLNGIGDFPKNEGASKNSPPSSPAINVKTESKSSLDLFTEKESVQSKNQDVVNMVSSTQETDIEKIVVFFTDGTFKSYTGRK